MPALTRDEMVELYELLGEYGNAKFGDEWWPGNAEAWLPQDRADRLAELTERL
jgi:hypothetical protein